jgi:hypothetical protein
MGASFLIYGYNTDGTYTLLTAQKQERHAVKNANIGIAKSHIKQPSFGYQSVKKREQDGTHECFRLQWER